MIYLADALDRFLNTFVECYGFAWLVLGFSLGLISYAVFVLIINMSTTALFRDQDRTRYNILHHGDTDDTQYFNHPHTARHSRSSDHQNGH